MPPGWRRRLCPIYLCGNIPTFVHSFEGKLHDVNVLDILLPEPGAFSIMDRGYVDFRGLFILHLAGAFFLIRAKSNTKYRRRYSQPVDKSNSFLMRFAACRCVPAPGRCSPHP